MSIKFRSNTRKGFWKRNKPTDFGLFTDTNTDPFKEFSLLRYTKMRTRLKRKYTYPYC